MSSEFLFLQYFSSHNCIVLNVPSFVNYGMIKHITKEKVNERWLLENQVENLESRKSQKSRVFIPRLLSPTFRFGCRVKSKTRKKFSKISEIFNFSEFSIYNFFFSLIHSFCFQKIFFQFFINVFTFVSIVLYFHDIEDKMCLQNEKMAE